MRCPYCGNPDTRVIDSRPAEDKSSIRRRRSCDECGKRFTTYEKVETIPLIVIKKDNNREQYQRSKIENGVLSACYKRPVPADQIQKTIEAIELEIFNREEKEIPSSEIGEIVMDKAIVAEDVVIGNNVVIGCGEEVPNVLKPAVYSFGLVAIGENSVIPDSVKIGKNTAIAGVTTKEDYPDGELAAGQVIAAKDGGKE